MQSSMTLFINSFKSDSSIHVQLTSKASKAILSCIRIRIRIRIAYLPHVHSLYCEHYNTHIIQICSGITRGRVLNGELYTQRFKKLICIRLQTVSWRFLSILSSININPNAGLHMLYHVYATCFPTMHATTVPPNQNVTSLIVRNASFMSTHFVLCVRTGHVMGWPCRWQPRASTCWSLSVHLLN